MDYLTPDLITLILICIPFSLFIGFCASAIGLTAWPLVVPLLFVLFGFDLFLALFISLLVDCCNALVKTIHASRKGMIDFNQGMKLALVACLFVFPGIYAGISFIPQNTELFKGAIGIITMVFGIAFVMRGFKKKKEAVQDSRLPHLHKPGTKSETGSRSFQFIKRYIVWLLTASVAFQTGLLGMGGGMLYAVFLIACLAYPTMKATGTAMLITCCSTLFAAIGFLLQIPGKDVFNHSIVFITALIVGISILGTVIGERVTYLLSDQKINFLIGGVIIFSSLFVTVEKLLLK